MVTTSPTTHNYYDRRGRLIASEDANSNALGGANRYTTRHHYDAAGQLIKTTAADGGVATLRYDAFGRKIGAIDELGRETVWTYDRANHVTKVRHMLSEERYAYDELGHRR